MLFLWFSMVISPGTMTAGMLGPIFGLSVNDSVVITVFAAAVGCIVPAFTATLCPPAGLRQIAVARYALGIWGSKLCGLLNIIVNIGFGTINCIIAGQLISAVSDGTVTVVAGIVILSVLSYILSLFGFRVLHYYEKVAWVLILVLICVNYGQSAQYFSPTPALSYSSGMDRTGAALSYFAIILGVSAAWCSMAGDYYVHYPANISKWLVFWMTWVGLFLPNMFIIIFGVLLGGVVLTNETMSNTYYEDGFGALILATMSPSGWSKFVCVVYALSFCRS
jgi:purine-cytosine permease-like protein